LTNKGVYAREGGKMSTMYLKKFYQWVTVTGALYKEALYMLKYDTFSII